MQATRQAIKDINPQSPAHAGLYFQRLLQEQDDKNENRGELLTALCNMQSPKAYKTAFERWRRQWDSGSSSCVSFELSLAGTLAIGMGNDNPTENGLTLHHTYGVPVIPGSALKGLTLRVMRRYVAEGTLAQDVVDALFGKNTESGDNGEGGLIRFEDAWFVPNGTKPFHRDVLTVHHPKYYGDKGEDSAPTDFDDPNPVAFLVVHPKSSFFFALTLKETEGVPVEWLEYVRQSLEWGLCQEGIGGKTNAGYGYFDPVVPPPPPEPVEEVWEACTLLRVETSKTEWKVTVSEGKKPLEITKQEWDSLRGDKTPPKQKGDPFNANVTVLVDGEKYTVVKVERTKGVKP